MLRLQDIMTRDVVTVSPQLSMRDAMDLLTTLHITGAPVVSCGKVVGVVSLTDLVEFAAATPGGATELEIADGGEFENPTVWMEEEDPPAAYFAQLWEDSADDVVDRIAGAAGPEWSALEEHTVAEAMNRKLSALLPDATVEHAAEVMRRASIHRILVMEDDKLLGLVTTTDISAAVADHKLTTRVFVFGSHATDRGV